MSDGKKKRVTAAEFVTVWQNAETMTEVTEALEMKAATAQVRASTYRKKGVLLKKFQKGGKSFDVNALNELIAGIEAPVLGNVDVDVPVAADEEAA
jgi:vacuolar-type H+-ATPase subunit D/Vma8